jgi:hypothetical protein
MLTRFNTNIALYPRLWKLYVAGVVLAVVEFALGGRYPNIVYGLTIALAVAIYLWVTRSASRTAVLLNVLNAFEGREICTVAGHVDEDIDDDCTCDNEQGCLVHDEGEDAATN